MLWNFAWSLLLISRSKTLAESIKDDILCLMDNITIAGSAGWIPSNNRNTCCAYLQKNKHMLVIDAGTGLSFLVDQQHEFEHVETIDIVLTHFHLDHISGLAYLAALNNPQRIVVHAPGQALYNTASQNIIGALNAQPYHPISLEQLNIDIKELQLGENEISGVAVETRAQLLHSAPTMGLRFNDFTWITDTGFDKETAAFARQTPHLFHEAWFQAQHPQSATSHTSAKDAALVAQQSQADKLTLIHLPTWNNTIDAIEKEAQNSFADAEAAYDGMVHWF